VEEKRDWQRRREKEKGRIRKMGEMAEERGDRKGEEGDNKTRGERDRERERERDGSGPPLPFWLKVLLALLRLHRSFFSSGGGNPGRTDGWSADPGGAIFPTPLWRGMHLSSTIKEQEEEQGDIRRSVSLSRLVSIETCGEVGHRREREMRDERGEKGRERKKEERREKRDEREERREKKEKRREKGEER
jgi:hypothetical protein